MPRAASHVNTRYYTLLSRCIQRTHKYRRALINPKYRPVWYENARVNFGARFPAFRLINPTLNVDWERRYLDRGAVSLNHGRFCVSRARKKKQTEKKNSTRHAVAAVANRKWEPQHSTGVTVRKLRVFKIGCRNFSKICRRHFVELLKCFTPSGIRQRRTTCQPLRLVSHYNPGKSKSGE